MSAWLAKMFRLKYTPAPVNGTGRCCVFVWRVLKRLVHATVNKYLAAFHLCSFRGI